MRKIPLVLSLISILNTAPLAANSGFSQQQSSQESQEELDLLINPQVLWKSSTSLITSLDLFKHMNLFLLHQGQPIPRGMRKQYYTMHWKEALMWLVERDLILQEAKQLGLRIEKHEVHEEIARRLGPNYIILLDEAGISLTDLMADTEKELLVQRMITYKIQFKVRSLITPGVIRAAYREYAEQNPEQELVTFDLYTLKFSPQASVQAFTDSSSESSPINTQEESERAPSNTNSSTNSDTEPLDKALELLKQHLTDTKASTPPTPLVLEELLPPEKHPDIKSSHLRFDSTPLDALSRQLQEQLGRVDQEGGFTSWQTPHAPFTNLPTSSSPSTPSTSTSSTTSQRSKKLLHLLEKKLKQKKPFHEMSAQLELQLFSKIQKEQSALFIEQMRDRYARELNALEEKIATGAIKPFQP